MSRAFSAILATCILLALPAYATETLDQGGLTPGGAAGAAQAQNLSVPVILSIVGVVAAGAAVVILISNSHHASAPKTATKS